MDHPRLDASNGYEALAREFMLRRDATIGVATVRQWARRLGGSGLRRGVRAFFIAFTLRLPAARRILYIGALVIALVGLLRLFRRFMTVEVPFGLPFFHVAMRPFSGASHPGTAVSAAT